VRAHRQHNGFTLIELMIAVAIIAILSALIFGFAGNYLIRSRVATTLLSIAQAKRVVEEYYQTQDRFPAYGDSSVNAAVVGIAGFGTSNQYLDSVTLDDDGTVSAIFADDGALGEVKGAVVSYQPTVTSGVITWGCSVDPVSVSFFMPVDCR